MTNVAGNAWGYTELDRWFDEHDNDVQFWRDMELCGCCGEEMAHNDTCENQECKQRGERDGTRKYDPVARDPRFHN